MRRKPRLFISTHQKGLWRQVLHPARHHHTSRDVLLNRNPAGVSPHLPEIMNILILRRHTTARELADELGVTTRTIQRDIQALSPGFPVYTRQGGDGGIYIGDDYKPYVNTLSADELNTLCEIYRQAEGVHKKILLQILHKYGPDKLEI